MRAMKKKTPFFHGFVHQTVRSWTSVWWSVQFLGHGIAQVPRAVASGGSTIDKNKHSRVHSMYPDLWLVSAASFL